MTATDLESVRQALNDVNVKDIVPLLVARRVLHSFEMSQVYGQQSQQQQMETLIEILKTKTHWIGPMTDALIRNGKALVAQQLMEVTNGTVC